MTRLGRRVPKPVADIRDVVVGLCGRFDYRIIDASQKVTGRDFLLKIWKMIASVPLAIGICHKEIPKTTQDNIYYELGVAQALGKETLLIKSPEVSVPSDFVRTEYVEFDDDFSDKFSDYLKGLFEQAGHYELVAEQLERNPILAIDYLKRAYLISGEERLKEKAKEILNEAGLQDRAKNSVERLAAAF